MDILDEPLEIKHNPENYKKLILQIPKLGGKIKNRGIQIKDENIIFLNPGHGYHKELKKEFPESKIIKWIDFRTSPV